MLKKTFSVVGVLLFGIGMAAAGWWFGFRDGLSMAYTQTGGLLATVHKAAQDSDPAKGKAFLDIYSTDVACHLLRVQHRFPMMVIQPYKARMALAELRAVWQPDPQKFRIFSSAVPRYYGEGTQTDYFAAWEAVSPAKHAGSNKAKQTPSEQR